MNLPESFLADIRKELGDKEAGMLCSALVAGSAPVSIRLNSGKGARLSVEVAPVPWCGAGYYLTSRPAFTFDPLFHAGMYYVQEASSMFLNKVLAHYVSSPVKMLDLCAAPGGKSTLALQALPEGSLLVSNEYDKLRSRILAENITKWGCANVMVTNNAPADFSGLHHYFDVVLADVPCSGEGMFRKDPQAVEEWSGKNVAMCAARQRGIVEDCWKCLKPGGLFIYSTCTYNIHENEENVHWIAEHMGTESLTVETEASWGIEGNKAGLPESVYHFFPHRTKGEGFFIAILRKAGGDEGVPFSGKPLKKGGKQKGRLSKGKNKAGLSLSGEMSGWLDEPGNFTFKEVDDSIVAVPKEYADDFMWLDAQLYVLQKGITLAVRKGKKWAPAHPLAMSSCLALRAFPHFEAPLPVAWAYLRGEAFALPSGVPVGFVLVTYKGHPLGFVKNIGTRCNNLYPQNWKIRTGHFPDPSEELSLVQ